MQKTKSVTISFLGNGNFDTRVTNITSSLKEIGYNVKVISFDWTSPNFESVIGDTSIYKLEKKKNSLPYYIRFISILFRELLKTNSSIYIAEDIFTLPVVTFVAKFRGAKLYYNSREFYAFLAGLRNKPKTQAIIRLLEKFFIKKVDAVLVTGDGDSEFLEEYYSIKNTVVIRNLPKVQKANEPKNFHTLLNIPDSSKVLLYQGVILEGRGFEPLLSAMTKIKNCDLVVLGTGVFQEKYKKLSIDLGIENRIHFLGNIDQSDLVNYTSGADIGVSIIENISKSYYYALPNKLFEYIMANIPVLISDLPQMKKIVDNYNVGKYVNLESENDLENVLSEMLTNLENLEEYKRNCIKASKELNWEREFEKVKYLFVQ